MRQRLTAIRPRTAASCRSALSPVGDVAAFARVVALGAALVVIVAACTSGADVPPLERRAQEIDKAVMCPICPGESIDQSQAAIAKQMRDIVRQKLEEGWTEEEVKGFFVERYGPRVLMAPPSSGINLAAWVFPPVGTLAGLAALFLVLRRMRHDPQEIDHRDQRALQLRDDEEDEYVRRVQALLEAEVDTVDSRTSNPATKEG